MTRPGIAFFDLDHTLIGTDCELTWKNMLADQGLVPDEQRERQQHYIDLHAKGETPEEEYLEFFLREFVGRTPEEMAALARTNFEEYVQDTIYPQAQEEIRSLQAEGIPAVLLSGSSRVLVTPIAAALGLSDVACTELELVNGRYTGRVDGPFCIREGKLKRGIEYCRLHSKDFSNAVFYGDSISDIPIFESVGQAVVINPNETLEALARKRNWRTVRWESGRA